MKRKRGPQDGVYRRGKWWCSDYYVNGRRHRRKLSTEYETAKLLVRNKQVAIARGEITGVTDETTTVKTFIGNTWRPALESRLDPTWYQRVVGIIDTQILPVFGDGLMAKLSAESVELWATVRRGQVKASTFNKELQAIKNLAKHAAKHRALTRFVAAEIAAIPRQPESRGRIRYLTTDEYRLLLDGKEQTVKTSDGRSWTTRVRANPRLALYVRAALATGARRSELIRLRWSEVDLRAGLLTFLQTKNGDLRVVPINATMRALLLGLPRPLDATARVFPQVGDPLVISRAFRRLCDRLGIVGLRFHDLRHDAASQLAMAGMPLRDIAEVLGHHDLKMTLRYAHLAPRHLAETMRVLDTRVEPGGLDSHAIVTSGSAVSRK